MEKTIAARESAAFHCAAREVEFPRSSNRIAQQAPSATIGVCIERFGSDDRYRLGRRLWRLRSMGLTADLSKGSGVRHP